jgi:hypothetical protein
VTTRELSLQQVCLDIWRNPYEFLVRRWNWKAGVMSGMIRATIFFTTNLPAGRDAAIGATLTEFAYRILFSGSIGSVTEAVRECQPAWAATLAASVVLPVFGHVVEFTIHYLRGTPRVGTSVAVSIGFSALSTLFNLYLMRRGVLVVGKGGRSFLADLATLPRHLVGFAASGPVALWRMLRNTDRKPL